MLCSSEALYGITNSHIEKLEQVDRMFFRRLFEVPNCTAIEAFYLETSSLPIRYLLMGRRLIYLWDILHKNDSELVRKVFNSQKVFYVKHDWAQQVKHDLEECGIDLTDEEISNMKRISFKKLVTKQIKLLAARYLTSLKLQHSKSEHLIYSEDMQPYLRNESLKIEEKKLMFKIRNRLIDVKSNFKKKYQNNLICRLCEMAEESQSHLVNCTVILGDSSIKSALEQYTYNDIFSANLETQAHMINTFRKIMKFRTFLLNKEDRSSSQASPDISGASYTAMHSVRHWI